MDRMKMKGWICKYEIDRVKNLGWAVQDEMSRDEIFRRRKKSWNREIASCEDFGTTQCKHIENLAGARIIDM